MKTQSNKNVAGLLALLVGAIGIHKFYLGKPFQGFGYILLFMFTGFLPIVISVIEGIYYFSLSEEDWHKKYNS